MSRYQLPASPSASISPTCFQLLAKFKAKGPAPESAGQATAGLPAPWHGDGGEVVKLLKLPKGLVFCEVESMDKRRSEPTFDLYSRRKPP